MADIKVFRFDNADIRVTEKDGNPWWVLKDVCEVPVTGSTDWHGCVYAIEYGDFLKIGHTTKLKQRMKSLAGNARNYSNAEIGRIAHSAYHTNHKENEAVLHAHFKHYRSGKGELFAISLDDFLRDMPKLEFKDESEKTQEKSEVFFQTMKGFIMGGVSK